MLSLTKMGSTFNTSFLRLIICTFLFFTMSSFANAGTPLWTITALSNTEVTVPKDRTAIVTYRVTNQSPKTHTLNWLAPPGIQQITSNTNNCINPFTLASKQHCVLVLRVDASQVKDGIQGPVICEQNSTLQCYQPIVDERLKITIARNVYSIGGDISGLIGHLELVNNLTDEYSTTTDGPFTFTKSLPSGSPYFVSVKTQPLNQTCTVNNDSGIIHHQNVTDVLVTCSDNAYTVGGTLSGLTNGETLTILNNGKNPVTLNANGNFTFSTPIAEGSFYRVTVKTQPSTQTCTISNGSGQMGGSNVTDVNIVCATNTYTVGGTLTGLTGIGVGLLNNDSDPLEVTKNGSFQFSQPIAEGSYYSVFVFYQPSGQTCVVTNGGGGPVNANVTDIVVSCTSNTATLALEETPLVTIPVPQSGPPTTAAISVTNIGNTPAINVRAILPSGWTSVDQNATACTTLAPGDSCNLLFSSTKPYIAKDGIAITCDNITGTIPTVTMAFTIGGYYVWEILSNSSANVLASELNQAGTYYQWCEFYSNFNTDLYDGVSNTLEVNNNCPNSAASVCYLINSDSTGTVPAGTWFLPAICQLGGEGLGAGCTNSAANINTNLFAFGLANLPPSGNPPIWSSSEQSANDAYYMVFASSGSSQTPDDKANAYPIYCARPMDY